MSRVARRRRAKPAALEAPRCVLDSGGLTALVDGSQRARAWLRWVSERVGDVIVPTAILVETTTGDGARDAEINRVLGILARATGALAPATETVARAAGRLRFRAHSDDGIDALVAAEAAGDSRPCVVLTSDPDDLAALLSNEAHVEVRTV